MRAFVLLGLFLKCHVLLAQTVADTTSKTDFGLTTYIFADPFGLNSKSASNSASAASGPAVFFSDHKKLAIQLSLLFDFKAYRYQEYSSVTPFGGHVNVTTKRNLFIPLSVNYRFYKGYKINCFVSAGIILGGLYYSDGTPYAQYDGILHFT